MQKKHRDNLEKLAAYLEGPALTMKFDMENYCTRCSTSEEVAYGDYDDFDDVVSLDVGKHTCGTVACAIGHGPAAGIRPRRDGNWAVYSQRVFGVKEFGAAWEWMFGYTWADTDNTPAGAAARIRWFLKYGLPEDWRAQMLGAEPLCY